MLTENDAKSLDLTQTNSPSISEITMPAKEISLPTGTALSGRGLETLRSLVRDKHQKPTASEINKTLEESLRQDFGSLLVFEKRLNASYEITGYQVKIRSEPTINWMEAINFFMRPCGPEKATEEVTRLRTLTARRKEDGFDLEVCLAAIAEELSVYPYDIVRTVCREMARTRTFFPVLKELIDECENLIGSRRAISKAFEKPVIKLDDRSNEAEKPTEDQKAAVSSMVSEFLKQHGMEASA